MSISTTAQQSHKQSCTPEQAQSVGCLNGGECFAWDSGGQQPSLGCSCPSGWVGDRCEYRYIDPDDVSEGSAMTIGLAVGLTSAALLTLVLLLVFFLIRKRRQRQGKQQTQTDGPQPRKEQYNDLPSCETQESVLSNSLSFPNGQPYMQDDKLFSYKQQPKTSNNHHPQSIQSAPFQSVQIAPLVYCETNV